MTLSAQRVSPAFHTGPRFVWTLGDEVADLNTVAGFPPDPEQRPILDDIFGVDEAGRSVFEVAVIAPRQNIQSKWVKEFQSVTGSGDSMRASPVVPGAARGL